MRGCIKVEFKTNKLALLSGGRAEHWLEGHRGPGRWLAGLRSARTWRLPFPTGLSLPAGAAPWSQQEPAKVWVSIRRGSQERRTLGGRWEREGRPTPLRKAKKDRTTGGESGGKARRRSMVERTPVRQGRICQRRKSVEAEKAPAIISNAT